MTAQRKKAKTGDGSYIRIMRLLNLILKMQNRFVTKKEICEELRRDKRTAERTVARLEEMFGTNLERSESAGECVAWRIVGRKLPPLPVATDDILLLNRLSDFLYQNNQESDAERLKRIREQLSHALENAARAEVELELLEPAEKNIFRPGLKVEIKPDVVRNIRSAIKNQTLIEVEYRNKKSGKTNVNTLEPYGILYNDRSQYLLARHCDGYFGDDIHHFLLSNIISVTPTDRQFKAMDFDLAEYMKDSFGVYREKPYDVEWKFSAKAAPEADAFVFHPDQKKIKNPDGSLTVKFRAGGTLEMAWHLYTWGDQVEVVKPADFWDRAKKAEEKRWK